jgi:hypothetical protein
VAAFFTEEPIIGQIERAVGYVPPSSDGSTRKTQVIEHAFQYVSDWPEGTSEVVQSRINGISF